MSPANNKLVLTLYSRANCHLCEDLLIQLQQPAIVYNFTIKMVDIDSSQEYYEQYNLIIPYLCYENEQECVEICKYFYDEQAITQFFKLNLENLVKPTRNLC
jgi:hypothetical protein